MQNILVISLGGAPQVMTETLWALAADPARAEDKRFAPDEVHVLTAAAGAAAFSGDRPNRPHRTAAVHRR